MSDNDVSWGNGRVDYQRIFLSEGDENLLKLFYGPRLRSGDWTVDIGPRLVLSLGPEKTLNGGRSLDLGRPGDYQAFQQGPYRLLGDDKTALENFKTGSYQQTPTTRSNRDVAGFDIASLRVQRWFGTQFALLGEFSLGIDWSRVSGGAESASFTYPDIPGGEICEGKATAPSGPTPKGPGSELPAKPAVCTKKDPTKVNPKSFNKDGEGRTDVRVTTQVGAGAVYKPGNSWIDVSASGGLHTVGDQAGGYAGISLGVSPPNEDIPGPITVEIGVFPGGTGGRGSHYVAPNGEASFRFYTTLPGTLSYEIKAGARVVGTGSPVVSKGENRVPIPTTGLSGGTVTGRETTYIVAFSFTRKDGGKVGYSGDIREKALVVMTPEEEKPEAPPPAIEPAALRRALENKRIEQGQRLTVSLQGNRNATITWTVQKQDGSATDPAVNGSISLTTTETPYTLDTSKLVPGEYQLVMKEGETQLGGPIPFTVVAKAELPIVEFTYPSDRVLRNGKIKLTFDSAKGLGQFNIYVAGAQVTTSSGITARSNFKGDSDSVIEIPTAGRKGRYTITLDLRKVPNLEVGQTYNVQVVPVGNSIGKFNNDTAAEFTVVGGKRVKTTPARATPPAPATPRRPRTDRPK